MALQRRHFLLGAAFSGGAAAAAEKAHREIWRRFIDKHGVMLDFTELDGRVSLPAPEECRDGKPNALGWWSPIENGAMFNGYYLDAALHRWRRTKSRDAAAKARRLMEGLLLLASVSEVKGFVGRGLSTDGRSHYPMGSNDQTLPWFYGLWRYWGSGLATGGERKRIKDKLETTADAIVGLKWKMPAEPPFGVRGTFDEFGINGSSRKLFMLKSMSAVTGERRWEEQYRRTLAERPGAGGPSRLEDCAGGMKFEYAPRHNWTSCGDVAALRSLWEMERDATLKSVYARGLAASADLAAETLPLAAEFDHNDPSVFNADWRMMNAMWKPQRTEEDAVSLAQAQLREFLKVSPRRGKETAFVREPTSAAWIVTLDPDPARIRRRAAAIEAVINRYDYSRLYYSQFFWVESAWERLAEC